VGTMINNFVALRLQMLDDLVLEFKTCVITSDMHLHLPTLSKKSV
jgi:hypothetical protein